MESDTEARPLGPISTTALVIASMIGAGVFTTSGFALADLRSPGLVLLAWVVGGLIALCGAASYGQLVTRLTESGGEYLFLTRFVHPAAGFVAGWVSMLAGFTGAGAFAALVFEQYAVPPDSRPDWLPAGSVAALLISIATLAHARSTRGGATRQNIIVLVKLGLLGGFLVVAFLLLSRWQGGESLAHSPEQPPISWLAFATTVMWISLSYSGFNAAVYVAGEVRGGAPVLRAAMLWATLGVFVLYLLMNTVFLYAPAPEAIAGQADVAAIAAASLGGTTLAWLVRVAICLGLASSVFSILMAGPRVYSKMAEDGLLPPFLRMKKSPPTAAVILQGAALLVVTLTSGLSSLLSYLGLTLSLSTAATVSTLLFLPPAIAGEGTAPSTLKRWAAKLIPAVYVTATLIVVAVAAWNRPAEAQAAALTILTGLLVYGVWKWLPTARSGTEQK